MKKVLSWVSFVIGNVLIASAQITGGEISGTIGGNPISVSFGSKVAGGPLIKLIALAQKIITLLVPLLMGLALIVFFWYLIMYIAKGDEDPAKRQEGLRGMGYSILAIFVMVSIWGIVAFIGSIVGIGQGGRLPVLEMPKVR